MSTQIVVLPVLSHVDATIAGYYQGGETFVPFHLFRSPQMVYVVRLGMDEQGTFQLSYHVDARTGEPVVCPDMKEARRVCRQLNCLHVHKERF